MKLCPKCKTKKLLDCFSRNRSEADGLHSWCKVCNNNDQRTRYANTPVAIRKERTFKARHRILANRLKTRYNLTIAQLEELKKNQNGKCLICSSVALAIDHDHSTGKVRGLLCIKCNAGLGYFNDDPELLLKAIEYLERTK